MELGEVSDYLVHPRYSWTERGFDMACRMSPRLRATLPALASDVPTVAGEWVKLRVKLLSFIHESKVTEDGKITKRVIVHGDGGARPNDGAVCQLEWQWRFKGEAHWRPPPLSPLQSTFHTITVMEDARQLWGLEESVKNMHTGEHSHFNVSAADYGFIPSECDRLGLKQFADTIIELDVRLLSFTKGTETWQLSDDGKVDYMDKWKSLGNQSYEQRDVRRAIKKYLKVLMVFQYDGHLSDEVRQRVNGIKVLVHSNMALCKSLLPPESLTEAVRADVFQHCNEALRLDPNHVKSLFRRAASLATMGDDDLALQDLQQILTVEPDNARARKEAQEVRARIDARAAKQRQSFKGAFSGNE